MSFDLVLIFFQSLGGPPGSATDILPVEEAAVHHYHDNRHKQYSTEDNSQNKHRLLPHSPVQPEEVSVAVVRARRGGCCNNTRWRHRNVTSVPVDDVTSCLYTRVVV